MKLIMFGAPGAGKGTQAAILGQRLDVPTISTGNILRAAVTTGTPVGRQARSYIAERLAEPDCQKGYILDGVPRTIAQAEALEEAGIQFDCVLDIEVPDQEILHRMIGRRSCPICGATYHLEAAPPKVEGKCDHCGNTLTQREDDKHETVISRLSTYHAQTEPLKKFYADRGILKVVAFQPSIEATTQAIAGILGI